MISFLKTIFKKDKNIMKIQIASDLHIEHFKNPLFYHSFIKPSADILILAGDIGNLYQPDILINYLSFLSEKFTYILYIYGNTEFYFNDDIQVDKKNMETLKETFENKVNTKLKNIFILDQKSIQIGNYLFSGCTLWSKLKMNLPNNYRIKNLTSKKYIENHYNDIKFLKMENIYCKENNLEHIIITHHVPLILDPSKKKKDMYMTDLSNIIHTLKINTWIFGHIHNNFNFIVDRKMKMLSNQRGKPGSYCNDYKTDFVIEI